MNTPPVDRTANWVKFYLAAHSQFIHSNAPWEEDQLLCGCTAAVYRAGVTSTNRRSGQHPSRMRSTVHPGSSFTGDKRSQMHTASRHAELQLLPPTAASWTFEECFHLVSSFEINFEQSLITITNVQYYQLTAFLSIGICLATNWLMCPLRFSPIATVWQHCK